MADYLDFNYLPSSELLWYLEPQASDGLAKESKSFEGVKMVVLGAMPCRGYFKGPHAIIEYLGSEY